MDESSPAPAPAPEQNAGGLPVMEQPYAPPPPDGAQALMVSLGPLDPLRWLAAGWSDLLAHPGISLFYGLCFWGMAAGLAAVFHAKPEYTLSLVSGCLLAGPFLALGLYEVSRRRQHGLVPTLGASLTCWQPHLRSMGTLVIVLVVLELLWGRASLVVFAVFFNTGLPSTTGVVNAVFNADNLEFVAAYLVVGGVFAALVFATSVLSIPMILERDTDAVSASIVSIRVVLFNPAVMLFWGALITVLLTLTLWLAASLGVILIGPLLGHASWHAYSRAVQWRESIAPPVTRGDPPA